MSAEDSVLVELAINVVASQRVYYGSPIMKLAVWLTEHGHLNICDWHAGCQEPDLESVQHIVNQVDWNEPSSRQSYQVYRCRVCGDYWGCRHQWDAGSGQDDIWCRFGPDTSRIHLHDRGCSCQANRVTAS